MYPEYLFTVCGDLEKTEVAAIENLNVFANQLINLNAAVVGGKIAPKDAEKRVKDLYKQWKASNKLLKE